MAIKTRAQLTTGRDFGDLLDSVDLKIGPAVQAITAARTLTAQDSGTIFTLDSAGGAYAITLPTVALSAGLVFKFIVLENTPSNDITISSNAANIFGNLLIQADTAEDNRVAAAGVTSVLVDQVALKGDMVEFIGTGANYFVTAMGGVQGAFTTA
tara:strand:+ start:28 stop:492 length:465 start_codon:yes stop_codon:yes gene_type:complete